MDFEAVEFFVRTEVLRVGASILEKVLDRMHPQGNDGRVQCSCGHVMRSEGRRTKTIRTILGKTRSTRRFYRCLHCGKTAFPNDTALDVVGTGFSPGARRMMTRAGSREPFNEAADDLHLYAQLDVSPKDVERVAEQVGQAIDRWMQRESTAALLYAGEGKAPPSVDGPIPILYISFDGTGIPMRHSELTATKSKTPGQPAKTREVKLGCVFTQVTLDKEGHPVRDPDSTTYVGAIENSVEFGYRIHGEAVRRGLQQAVLVVVLSDGAHYNKSIATEHFPLAIFIIDLYHAREHLSTLIKLLWPGHKPAGVEQKWTELLNNGEIEHLLQDVRNHLPRSGKRRHQALKQLPYFEQNAPYMRYAEFRKKGLFVGSGVVEAGCKTVIGKRLKQSGMFWSTRGANAIIAARCCDYSGRFEQFWEDQAA